MDYDDFHGQFVLHPVAQRPIPCWPSWDCGPWRLSAHPGLPVARIVLGDGTLAGFAMGHMINRNGELLQGDIQWPLPPDPSRAEPEIRSRLSELDGRYAVAVLGSNLSRVYLDAAGTLAAVFCQRRRRVASTPGLIAFDEVPNPVFARDPTAFPADRPDQFFPAGLTCDPEIRRLLPNHNLDIGRWIARRYFPDRAIEWVEESEAARCVQRIHRAVRRQIEAVVRTHNRVYIALTAGSDSRSLLACARDFMDRVECVTFHGDLNLDSRRIDRQIPALLASRLGFRHTILETRGPVPPESMLAYHRRTGFVLNPGKARDFDLACRRQLDLSAAWLAGFAGEVGRAVYWNKKPPPQGPVDAHMLLSRMGLKRRTELLEPLDEWLATLPPDDAAHHLTLAYIEHRVAAWASTHLYGGAPFRTKLHPFCSHEVFENMLRLPPAYQRRNAMTRDLIQMAWPELLSLPFNADPGILAT